MGTYNFSGHDTFHCRQFWLKKAFDYVDNKKSFTDNEASLELGVGKNMVTAIRYWSQCFQVLDGEEPTDIGNRLFQDKGWDPFLEDHGSLWLLHYLLITSEKASTFYLVFNQLIRERPEFNTEHFVKYINQLDSEEKYNQNTLKKDFTVFYRTYYADFKANDIEESFNGILTELNILKQVKRSFIDTDGKAKTKEVWVLERSTRNDIPAHILLYAIVTQHPKDKSISFEQLYEGKNEIGSVFALSKEGLAIALEKIVTELSNYQMTFSNEAGVRELQFKKLLNPIKILEDYYGR